MTSGQNVRGLAKNYAQETSVHCAKYIVEPSVPLAYRLLWALAIAAACGGLFAIVFMQLADMLSYRTKIDWEVVVASQLPFPSVTLCNMNLARRSQVILYPGIEEILLSRVRLHEVLDTELLNETAEDEPMAVTGADAQFIRSMAHTLPMTFVSCSWAGKSGDCSAMFTERLTETGVCFSFNTPENGLKESHVSRTAGSNSGLHLVLNVNQSEYVVTKETVSAGFNVILHDFRQSPRPRDGFTVTPGFSNSARLTMRQLEYLEAPYKAFGDTECKQPEGQKLKFFPRYDRTACLWECKVDYIQRKCACKNIYEPETIPVPYCNASQMVNCHDIYTDHFWNDAGLLKACPCSPPCSENRYEAGLSLSYFPSDAFANRLEYIEAIPGGLETYRKNVLELKIFFPDFVHDKLTQKPLYTLESISATLGGQLGLFLGVSILSVVELGRFLFSCLFAVISNVVRSRKHTVSHFPDKDKPITQS